MMLSRQSSFQALRGVLFAGLVAATAALGPLRDALVYAPNGAEVDHGATGSTMTAPKER